MEKIPTITIRVIKKNNWGALVAVAVAFGLGALYGKFSMAKEQEEKEDGRN